MAFYACLKHWFLSLNVKYDGKVNEGVMTMCRMSRDRK